MIKIFGRLFIFLFSKLNITSQLVIENIALRHQLSVLQRTAKKPKFNNGDRFFWMMLKKVAKNWQDVLVIAKPETVIKWHREGFKQFWKIKSQRKTTPGRKRIDNEIRILVLQIANINPFWGAPRIHGELIKLGIEISERTVSKIIRHRTKPPSQTWKTFLKNHMHQSVAIDFFTVPTLNFKVLFVLVVLSHDRRRVIHFNATFNPTAKWTARQMVEAFPWDSAPNYLLRDRDSIFGLDFQNQVKTMGITEIISAPKSPWQNPYVERVIGSIRRECLDHIIVLCRSHLISTLTDYFDYYNKDRTHYSLEKDAPDKRLVEHKPDKQSKVIAMPRVNGLHHRYEWKKVA